MFGLIAAVAVVQNVDTQTMQTGDIQQETEVQIQDESYSPKPKEILVHNGYSYGAALQDYVNYAYHLGGIDFVKLIECENGRRDPKRISKTWDFGLCQLNYKYNKRFINSPDFKDPYKQLDYCYEKYKINPKLWYGPNRRIEGKRCSEFVNNRFGILITYIK